MLYKLIFFDKNDMEGCAHDYSKYLKFKRKILFYQNTCSDALTYSETKFI